MILIAVVDDRGGMMFNHRRQSQDRILRQKILSVSGQGKLWMNAYSAKQFQESSNIVKDENFLNKAPKGDFCFVENLSVSSYTDRIEAVILFKWNRSYPGDFYFDIDLNDGTWELKDTGEFAGSSHENITMEVYSHI